MMARPPQYYHHGRSPAAWAGSITAAAGFALAAAGTVFGPNWGLIIAGAVVIVIAGLGTLVLKAMGFGQP